MKISTAIARLEAVQRLYGDIEIIGGYLTDNSPLRNITVINTDGVELWPKETGAYAGSSPVDGVFLD
ncbi:MULTISPECIES: hypothetical protein [Roseibium]|jgi:hypothetical protein|uniref:Uncharacterized protein n=1 Tax=Roseibium aggregatum TaxID=187304 RepID=A0A0M6YDC8_9HYPH|nr:hypothetical protein [Roseibium aggregatum]MEC9404463.1 hypothetical protein [Pseudomonadota bacterium]MEC9470160.1 hypothetical protein [Pseudomonadota bacterium]CTQ47688.1 hypothetical protein LAL4801_06150 [Roseibium aggregatum]